MKKILVIALIVILGLVCLGLAKDQIIKYVIVSVGSNVTGAKIEIGGFSLGLLKQTIRIKDFKIHNPVGFPKGVMADLPRVYVDADLFSILKGSMHLPIVTIELKELDLVKNQEGKLNVDSLKVAKQSHEAEEKKPAKPLEMQIDQLNLDMGKIVMKDYSVAEGPSVQVYDINMKKSYKNITSAQQLTALLMTEPMKAAGIRGAQIYGVSALVGVAVLPAVAAFTLLGKDSVENSFEIPLDKVYNNSLKLLQRIGQVKKEDKARGVIEALVNGVGVTVKCNSLARSTTRVTVSARKLLLPKPQVAGGVMYQINEVLK